jgi:tetratricopeptide (TPR) repeat protein
MKNQGFLHKWLGASLMLVLLAFPALLAQETISITTVSPQAREKFKAGREHFNLMNFSQSIEHLEKAIELDPSFALAHLYLSTAKLRGTWFEEKNLEKAVNWADRVSEGEQDLIYMSKALVEGDGQSLGKHRKNLIHLYPEDENARLWVSAFYLLEGDLQQAIDHSAEATRINPEFAPAYNILGYTYSLLGKPREAEKAILKGIELVPDNANIYDTYGDFLLRNGRFSESIVQFNKALELDPQYAISHRGLGDVYLFLGNFNQARKHYQIFSEDMVDHTNKFNGLLYQAAVDMHENRPDSALIRMDHYIQMAEEMNLPYNQIMGEAYKGYILTETGSPAEGLNQYRRAGKMIETANLPQAMEDNLNTQARLWEFYSLTANGDMEAAEQARLQAKTAIQVTDNPSQWKIYHQIYGVLQLHKGLYDQARQNLAQAWDSPETWYYMGLTWDKQGNKNKAQQWYQKVAYYYQNSLELGGVRNKALAGLKE